MPAPLTLAAGRLSGVAVAGAALAAATPLTPAALPHPLFLLATGLLLLIFASTAPLSTRIASGLGRPWGLAAGWLALMAYGCMQVSLFAWMREVVDRPWWMVIGGCWIVVTLGGLLRFSGVAWLLTLAVIAQLALTIRIPAGDWRGALDPATIGEMPRPEIGLLLLTAALLYAGFETTAPRGGVTSIVVIVLTLLYAYLSAFAVPLPRAAVVTGLLAGMLALHHAITRSLVSLGRERAFPPLLARPRVASVLQSLVIAGPVVVNVDANRLAMTGAIGLLVLLLGTSLATLLFRNRHPAGEGIWRRLFGPVLSIIGFGTLGWLAYENHRSLLIATAVPMVVGLVHAAVLRLAHPVVYAGIGLGGQAIVVAPSPYAEPPPVGIPRPRMPGAHRPERVNREELTG